MESRLERVEALLGALGPRTVGTDLPVDVRAGHDDYGDDDGDESQPSLASQSWRDGSPIWEGPSSFAHQCSLAKENMNAVDEDVDARRPDPYHDTFKPPSNETISPHSIIPSPRITVSSVANSPLQLEVVATILQMVQSMSYCHRCQQAQRIYSTMLH